MYLLLHCLFALVLIKIATQVLFSYRNLYFIYLRVQSQSFSLYDFVHLTSLDIVTSSMLEANTFINEVSPKILGQHSKHPLDRITDLYFLNTAEHFTLILSPQTNNDILISSAIPYLSTEIERFDLQTFEAAHSVILAVFSAPQNAHLITWPVLPFYVDALFSAFPQHLSPQQFCFAIKTTIRVSTPPSPLFAIDPDFADTLLELIHQSASTKASIQPLEANGHMPDSAVVWDGVHISEQAVLILALMGTLPYLPYDRVEDWLPRVAQAINSVDSDRMRDCCIGRLWDVMTKGEMDVERSRICAIWWGTKGGREIVLFGKERKNERSDLDALPAIARENKL